MLFGTNKRSGFIVRLGTCSKFTHVGIAVWVDNKQITLDRGQLFVFEMNKRRRFDILLEEEIDGAGLTSYDEIESFYSEISYRPLKEHNIGNFLLRTTEYIKSIQNYPFDSDIISFVNVWLQVDLKSKPGFKPKFICSELVYDYYEAIYQKPHLFGPEAPWLVNHYSPEIMTPERTPNTLIFENSLYNIKNEEDLHYSIFGPLVAAFVLCLVFILVFYAVKYISARKRS